MISTSTLRALEEALLDIPFCAVIITHDRWFLDRVATHILAFEGDSHSESGSKAITPITRPIAAAASVPKPISRTAFVTSP
jgi:ATPase subunit of ABC transporter with duplicated ATPase domains